MGTVIDFPTTRCVQGSVRSAGAAPATIIILPVIRIERFEEPTDTASDSGASAGRKKRRRTARR